jgi:hypothetical protein
MVLLGAIMLLPSFALVVQIIARGNPPASPPGAVVFVTWVAQACLFQSMGWSPNLVFACMIATMLGELFVADLVAKEREAAEVRKPKALRWHEGKRLRSGREVGGHWAPAE